MIKEKLTDAVGLACSPWLLLLVLGCDASYEVKAVGLVALLCFVAGSIKRLRSQDCITTKP